MNSRSQYFSNDPRSALLMSLLNRGMSNQPIQSPWQGAANIANGLVGALLMSKMNGEYDEKSSQAAAERSSAMAAAMGRPAETQSYGDGTTINWNEQKPNYFAASQMLGPDNEDLQTKMFEASAHERLAKETLRNEILKAKQLKEWEYENDPDKSMSRMMMDYMRGGMPSSQAPTASTVIPQTGGRDAAFLPPQIPPINASELSPTADNNPTPGIPIPAPPPPAQVGNTTVPEQPRFNPLGTMMAKKMGLDNMQINQDGTITQVPGTVKLTDDQSKAAGFADRMVNSMKALDETTDAALDISQRAKGSVPGVGNYLVSPEYQKFDQAQRDFVNAVLRRESGAVISPSEFDNAKKQYFPQPGDLPEVLAQKKQNRETALQAMARSAGQSYKLPESPKKAEQPAADPQAIVDELRKRGVIK